MSAGFEPPKYITSLISAINDAAKAAQTSALFLLGVGLYLVATVISTTDEDLLRGTAVQVAQLGERAPVAIAYALAPTIFLFLHVHTLIRFDMLAANLRLLTADLPRAVPLEADRERTRALLANVEFVQILASPPGSSFRSPLFRLMAWLIISVLPVAVLLAVQISFLRCQGEAITALHQVCLALDVAALSWFHTRLWLAGRELRLMPVGAFWERTALNGGLGLLIVGFVVVYAGVPSAERTTVGAEPVRGVQWDIAERYEEESGLLGAAWAALKGTALQPLDLAACPWLGFGCRFLRLNHRTLLVGTPPADVLVRLRTGKSDDIEKDLAHVEGLFLRGRALRFADFDNSRLYSADLSRADIRGASLINARLQGASLENAQLQGANLYWARLQGATLNYARLQGADLREAQLLGANLERARLQGADLREAQLQGASLENAQLQGADLRYARLWQTTVNTETNFGLVDLRGASWQPLDEYKTALLREITHTFPVRVNERKVWLEELITPGAGPGDPPDFAFEGVLFVDDVDDPRWKRLDRRQLTIDEGAYDEALVPFLGDLARSDADVARGLANRIARGIGRRLGLQWVAGEEPERSGRPARGLLNRAGPALPEDVREGLSKIASQSPPQEP